MSRVVRIALVCVVALGVFAPSALARKVYVSNSGSDSVSVIDTATNSVVGSPITVGSGPRGIAINPDGTRAYVANTGGGVSVISTATNTVVGGPIAVAGPEPIAITPDGSRVYAANNSSTGTVSVINTATNTVVGSPIPVGSNPGGIAITPDGTRAYIANIGDGTISVINTATNTVVGSPLTVGTFPIGIAITPDGTRAYVANSGSGNVMVINTATNTVVGSPITVGTMPIRVGITPDGTRAYVANNGSASVSVINTQTNSVVGSPITVGTSPNLIAFTPDGTRAYVANFGSNSVSVINTQTNTVIGTITVGTNPIGVAIVPDQPPKAQLSTTAQRLSATLNAVAPSDADGQVAAFNWNFGDGSSTRTTTPTTTHSYATPGEYTASVSLVDNDTCSTTFIFTGQTASCNGSAVASASRLLAALTIGKLKRNTDRGTARLTVRVPGPGTLELSGRGVVRQRPAAIASARPKGVKGKGVVKLRIRAKGKKKRILNNHGKVRLKVRVSFQPTGGDLNTQTRKVKLIKRG